MSEPTKCVECRTVNVGTSTRCVECSAKLTPATPLPTPDHGAARKFASAYLGDREPQMDGESHNLARAYLALATHPAPAARVTSERMVCAECDISYPAGSIVCYRCGDNLTAALAHPEGTA